MNALVFVVPLKSPAASNDWIRTVALALRCMASVYRQSVRTFRLVMAANEFPYHSTDPAIRILEDPYPIPATSADGLVDKNRKLQRCLVEAKEMAPCYVMKLDADDMIHRDLVKYVREREAGGFTLARGYLHADGRRSVQVEDRFHKVCGSSNIVRVGPDDLPHSMDAEADRYPILNCGHHQFPEFYEEKGYRIETVPFRAAVYSSGNGENHSGYDVRLSRSRREWLHSWARRRPLRRRIREDFCLVPIKTLEDVVRRREVPMGLPLVPK